MFIHFNVKYDDCFWHKYFLVIFLSLLLHCYTFFFSYFVFFCQETERVKGQEWDQSYQEILDLSLFFLNMEVFFTMHMEAHD